MEHSKAYHWLKQGKRRRKILLAIRQPMTARQLSQHTDITLDTCSLVLKELAGSGLVTCLNDRARRSRLYWLTQPGKGCQLRLRRERGLGVDDPIPTFDGGSMVPAATVNEAGIGKSTLKKWVSKRPSRNKVNYLSLGRMV